ncbi:LPD25 domain-containing protein [Bacillus cereus]|uniref:LPD25 domain-containing protein n=1 Tax=Bacillus cereus TaxID=1396 RepID=UPI0035CB6D4F
MKMAYKRKYQAKSVEQKQEEIQTLTKDMEKRVESYYTTPDQLKEYLSFMAKFYKYSTQNISLIENQFQGATAVGSFNFWKEKGFSVQKGEKGIKILVPTRTVEKFKDKNGKWKTITKASEEEKKQVQEGKLERKPGRLYFNIGHVFDISQTNATAKDLPTIFPNRWLDGNVESYKTLFKGMEAIAKNNGIKIIEPKSELGVAKGVSYTATKEVALNPRNTELQNVKTLLHELAHAKLHTTETHMNYTTSAKEFQAEMTAYAVSSYFGIDTSEYSLGYLASWTQGKELKDKAQLLKEVHETSVEFIETIEKTFERENNQSKDIGVEVMPKNENEKNIYLLRYGGLNHTEEEIISVADLRERSNRDTSFNEITNNEKLTDKEFISEFNKVNEERYIAIDQDEVTRPMMIVQWSESGFEKNQLIPFGEANEQMKERIREIELAKEEANSKGEYVPYEKARYHVVIPKEVDQDFGRMEIITPDRLDLGDGMYISPYHQILEEKPNLTDEVKQSLREEINNHNNNREQFNSVANEKVLHNDLASKEETIEFKGLYPVDESEVIYCEETGKPLEQDEEVYHKEGYGYIVPEKVNQKDIENGSVYFTTIGYENVEEKSLAPIQLEKKDEKLNLEDKINNQHTPLVTLEVLQNANSEEVGRIHMMDSETKEISQLSIWNEDKRNRDDLLINPINKDGKFENVYLNDFLKSDLYEKVKESIFEKTGNQSFVVHQDNAKFNLDKLTVVQRYSKIVEKSMFETEPKFTPQEIEAYRDFKKDGYAPVKVLDEKIEKVEKDLHTRYSNYQYAKLNEEPGNAQSILKRCSAEDKYYETKLVAVNGGYVKQEDVVKIESKVNESIKGIGSSPEVSKTYTAPQRTQINQTDLPNKSYVGGRNLSDKQQVDSPPVIDKNAKPVSKYKRKQEAEMER